MLRSQTAIQSIGGHIKQRPIHYESIFPKFIMGPGVPSGEPAVGSDGLRKKGKATPDTLV
jgi:hypothetical protein